MPRQRCLLFCISILQRPHLHCLALNLACRQSLYSLTRNVASDRNVGRHVGHGDLADLLARESGFASQGTQHVAGTDFFFAAAEDLQRDHRWYQRPLLFV